MSLAYSILYRTTNTYENLVHSAFWQFLIIPETNDNQEFIEIKFKNSLGTPNEVSINGYGFETIRVNPKKSFNEIEFTANFKLIKKDINPFDFQIFASIEQDYEQLNSLDFKIDFNRFLRTTHFTTLPKSKEAIFSFDVAKSIFENVQDLNSFTYEHLYFKVNVTNVETTLNNIIMNRHGVCQDFTHLFCAIARANKVPARYVSGYLHQGNGYFGDSQMHAWAEVYILNIGWVGFDPTNNLLVGTNHIKVCHGKDYQDCSPLKGIVYTQGQNRTHYSVQVSSQQQ
ncbi:transglutaminase family protein [Cellulophaga sp. E16_2]|uniref:transglutaminase-like domain-containing protein n=1 Tax=Cellulophaga sp. E16_2 TaxID=2789297 RepID=UPI001A93426C|nr:transglutaminase family protein [Cellulophaga sp. E16_2]MBO0593077.1 transglutaminase family protein [Cellulophaga sp. E16_2]